MKKTVTVFAATGTAGAACVNELIRQNHFNARVLVRKNPQSEFSSSGIAVDGQVKRKLYDDWKAQGVEIVSADMSDPEELIPALKGTDYLVSCVPLTATISQYPLIWAAREAGVERFVPSELGAIYEFEQYGQTNTVHRKIAREKAFIRRVIELAGLDFTIIPAGLWPEYYMLEPVGIMGDPDAKVAWSTGPDAGRIIAHVLAHPQSRNAICPVAATAYCSWNELLDVRDRVLGRKTARYNPTAEQWRAAYAEERSGIIKVLIAIGVAIVDTPAGMSLFGNWNKTHIPDFKGMPLEDMFRDRVEPFTEEIRKSLASAGALPVA